MPACKVKALLQEWIGVHFLMASFAVALRVRFVMAPVWFAAVSLQRGQPQENHPFH